MIVNSVFSIIRSENGNFAVTYKGNETHFNKEDVGEEEYNKTNNLYELLRNNPRGAMREKAMKSYLDITPEAEMPVFLRENGADTTIAGFPPTAAPVKEVSAKEKVTKAIKRLMNFFTEFSFTPSFRFVNTLSHLKSVSDMRTYVMNYFKLFDSAYTPEIVKKMDSAEFKAILADLVDVTPNVSPINTRLKVYYGPAGTGKTTLAQKEAENRCIVCNASMLPADLMEDFIFKDGNPDFNPSVLWNCMEEGKKIVLDEINLLPFDSLRFLQGIADGKTEFCYKNRAVHIKEGFQIIGTMNLSLGGITFGLPEPLVDRCAAITEFALSPEQLAMAVLTEGE